MRKLVYLSLALLPILSGSCSKYHGKAPENKTSPFNKNCPNREADLVKFDFSHTDLSGCDLSSLNLRGALFHGTILGETNFGQADLTDAEFVDAKIKHTIFAKADLLKVKVTNGKWVAADLREARLERSTWQDITLVGVNFDQAMGSEVSFNNTTIHRAQFTDISLAYTNFTDSVIQNSFFSQQNKDHGLANVHFSNTKFYNVDFENARCANCSFKDIDLFYKVDLSSARLDSVLMENTRMFRVRFDNSSVSGSFVNVNTIAYESSPPYIAEPEDEVEGTEDPADDLEKSSFIGTKLSNLIFKDSVVADLSFDGCTGSIQSQNTSWADVGFTNCQLKDPLFSEGSSLDRVNFSSSHLQLPRFLNTTMDQVSFSHAVLDSARFSSVKGKEGSANSLNFDNAEVSGLNFHSSKFTQTSFVNTTKFLPPVILSTQFDPNG